MSERKPLTLEELTELGVRAENGENIFVYCTPLNEWCKVIKYGLLFFGTEDYRSWREIEETYEKHWLAYATEPLHIDRSAWEPCDFCEKELDEYPYIVAHSDYDESNTCYIPAFCPICGRPLTDSAWDMLEKRLEFD